MPDTEAIQGQWVPLKAELNGEAASELVLRQTVFELAGGRYAMRFGPEVAEAGEYEHTAAPGPKSLVFRSTTGVNAGRTLPCIYQLAGDRLRVCWGLDGQLPAAFAAAAGSACYLVTYRRKPA